MSIVALHTRIQCSQWFKNVMAECRKSKVFNESWRLHWNFSL